MKNFEELEQSITKWASDKSLVWYPNHPRQFMKVMEELGETARAVIKKDDEAIKDGIGDTFVTLIILCKQLGLSPVECLSLAWEEIKNRTGKTVDGSFIKD